VDKEFSIASIIISCIVFGYLIVEFYKPLSSLAILIFMLCLSIVGFALSIISAKELQTEFTIIAVIIAFIAMATILTFFLIMLIMGM